MKRVIINVLIIAGLLVPQLAIAKKLHFAKGKPPTNLELKTHPVEEYLSSRRAFDLRKRNSNKLLVLMIEFQVDDDPQTTGDGTFLDSTDASDYPISLGKPPHDQYFFDDQLTALRYYYLAASYEHFELKYDIFPEPSKDAAINAYTLPNLMSYYNPPGASSDLMVQRFEQYFLDCFAVADEDDNIDFSEYEHFMFIHAGSDWQHDVFGDTPADIPSFFINVKEEEKMAYVDEGTVVIDNACNVPETITQDIITQENELYSEVYGYGLVNAVFAHEFGHSLGFIDLYNVRTFTPEVGYYDIMDSGGFGSGVHPVDEDDDGEYDIYYFLEGGFPVFPGIWSRLIAWENEFRQEGILKDISEINFGESIEIFPCETRLNPFPNDEIYFIKIPLNETEYVLLENRQVDPDGDSGTRFKVTDDERIILYPTVMDTLLGEPFTYEYDYMLPGWVSFDGRNYGGGIIAWHIDEDRLYENENFDNNSVNTSHSRRAVRIIEADGIEDIGNLYSYNWRGTEYEPFYRYMPKFDIYGYFNGWDDQYLPDGSFLGHLHNDSLSARTEPAFLTNDGNPSIFTIYEISDYLLTQNTERIMSFKIGTHLFDFTEKLSNDIIADFPYDSLYSIGNLGNLFEFASFPVYTDSIISYFSNVSGTWNYLGDDLYNTYNRGITQPILSVNYIDDRYDEFMFVSDSILSFISPTISEEIIFSSEITESPLFIEELSLLIVPTLEKLFIGSDSLDISVKKLAYDGTNIIAASNGKLNFIDPDDISGNTSIEIPGYESDFSPVCFIDSLNTGNNATFIQNKKGDIFKIQNGSIIKIFSLYSYTNKIPTQLAIGKIFNDGLIYLAFGAGNRIFAITPDGTMASGFPAYLEYKNLLPYSYPRIIEFDNEAMIILEEENQGFFAINNDADIRFEYSYFWNKTDNFNYFYWDEYSNRFFFIYTDVSNILYSSYIEGIYEDPIIWDGYRNGGYSLYKNFIDYQPVTNQKLTAFAYPNPAKNGEVRIKINNAQNNIDLKIFDIAGNIVHHVLQPKENNDDQDIVWDTRKIASGLYFGIVKSNGSVKKIPIAIEK